MSRRQSGPVAALVTAAALLAACEREPNYVPAVAPPGPVERFFLSPPDSLAADRVAMADSLVRERVETDAFPGAVLALGNRELIQHVAAHGRTDWDDDAPRADPDSTLYDLASLTKVVATTAAVMALVDDGRMDLDDPVRTYLPEFSGGDKDAVTLRHLLSHTGGLRAGVVEVPDAAPAEVRRRLIGLPLRRPPGEDVLYSDLGFVVLWEAAQRAAGEPLPQFLQRRLWGPLGMRATRVGVPVGCERCAPTMHLEERNEAYTGGSYDEVARRLDGIAGNAGAFTTGRDLARFAAMVANEGRLGDVRVLAARTVREFAAPQPNAGTRALGWEVFCSEGAVPDHEGCKQVYAFGHTGVTGTSLWIDPETRSWVILLANRTYLPREDTDMQALRRRLFETITGR